jgi:ATP-dependent Clp protease ATP-binding subunit ClpA
LDNDRFLDFPPMVFTQGLFSPEFVKDARARTVLALASDGASELVKPLHFLSAAIAIRDPAVLATISQALRPGFSLGELTSSLPIIETHGSQPSYARTREGFTTPALQVLDEFNAILAGSGGVLESVSLELLLHLALAHMPESERNQLAAINSSKATKFFRELVGVAMAPRAGHSQVPPAEDTRPFVLPPQLAVSDDLTHRARTAEPGPNYPFDGEPQYESLFDAMARVLHRTKSHHVLLSGERGVGKSAVIAELARRAASGMLPFLADKRFLTIDCRFIAPDESRQRLAAILAHVANNANLIVCVEGFSALLQGERAASNKPVLLAGLAHSQCRIVGMLTPPECDSLISDDPDFADFFTRLDVQEPDADTAIRILQHFALALAERFKVSIDAEAIRQSVLLSADFILNDQLPGKALNLLLRACEEIDYERLQLGRGQTEVSGDHIFKLVAQASGVPEETLRGVAGRTDYEQSLSDLVFGQENAVREVATELGLIKAGMIDPTKPASVMLFLGQTGTGKTELAKALARFYSTTKRLKTYTLGNCVEAHSVSTIIGVPPGYVGHDQGGRLVNDLNADPYCVFLLDEADKAHPDVLQPFLNLFDEGWVCDQRGLRAYGNKSIFILTSNVGQRMIAEMVQQGKSAEEIATRMKEALSQIRHSKSDRPVFTPEFLARLKRIIVFNPLDQAAMEGISCKFSAEMMKEWQSKRGKLLELPNPLAIYIADQGHRINDRSGGKEGGRVIRKLYSEWVEAKLQREASQRPEEYKQCTKVAVEFAPPAAIAETGPSPPDVSVHFR